MSSVTNTKKIKEKRSKFSKALKQPTEPSKVTGSLSIYVKPYHLIVIYTKMFMKSDRM